MSVGDAIGGIDDDDGATRFVLALEKGRLVLGDTQANEAANQRAGCHAGACTGEEGGEGAAAGGATW